MGATVVILALFVDPITQLIVRYHSCSVQLPDLAASIPRTNSFSEMGAHIGAGFSTLPVGFESAITAGLFNPETISIPFDCPTGERENSTCTALWADDVRQLHLSANLPNCGLLQSVRG